MGRKEARAAEGAPLSESEENRIEKPRLQAERRRIADMIAVLATEVSPPSIHAPTPTPEEA